MTGKFRFDEEAVRRLASILEETGLSEIEVDSGEQRIRVVRGGQAASAVVSHAGAPLSASPLPIPCAPAPQAANAVTAPMVGTVYVAPEPGAAPFVKVGDRVAEGQTLLIIEAMKVMNTIPAPRSGVVREILIQDGQPVEFGEPLLLLE